MKKAIIFLGAWVLAVSAGAAGWTEPETPMLETPSAPGFHGRAAPLERVTGKDAAGDEGCRVHRVAAWRNERVHAQYVVWSDRAVGQMRLEVTDFASASGARIPAAAVRARFVRYTRAGLRTKAGTRTVPERLVGDCLDDGPAVDLPANGYRPVWLTVAVPKDAAPGTYEGTLAVVGADGARQTFALVIDVRRETLPDPRDWAFFLDLWQHPWAVARMAGVTPFTQAHYDAMRPLLRELASAGQKTITTTLVDLPWNHQNYDAYHSMVVHLRQPDGSFRRDYALFDAYVAFARSCGLGPQIHCYTMASWGNVVYYTDVATGTRVKVKLPAGTPEHEAFWGPFLEDFQAHLKEKGWLGDVYVALDERSREELMATVACVRRHAPALKIQMAGNKPPSTFAGIEIHNYSQAMLPGHVTPAFVEEAKARRARGLVTTSYICCAPNVPNTFTTSSLAEARWLALYARARGLDGMLRWSAFNWPEDPLRDSSYGGWRPGDTYLLYPGARASTRWEALRDSIEIFEKMRVLGGASPAFAEQLARLLAEIDDAKLGKTSPAAYAAFTGRVEALIDAFSTPAPASEKAGR